MTTFSPQKLKPKLLPPFGNLKCNYLKLTHSSLSVIKPIFSVSISPFYDDHTSYWIGANDKHFEGDYRWADGSSFSFSSKFANFPMELFRCCKLHFVHFPIEWFPGWQSFDNYNRQPNDDGLSNQDCVEIRRHFNKPASSGSFMTDSFMWNDLDCSTENFFICERPLINGKQSNCSHAPRFLISIFLPFHLLRAREPRSDGRLQHDGSFD